MIDLLIDGEWYNDKYLLPCGFVKINIRVQILKSEKLILRIFTVDAIGTMTFHDRIKVKL